MSLGLALQLRGFLSWNSSYDEASLRTGHTQWLSSSEPTGAWVQGELFCENICLVHVPGLNIACFHSHFQIEATTAEELGGGRV